MSRVVQEDADIHELCCETEIPAASVEPVQEPARHVGTQPARAQPIPIPMQLLQLGEEPERIGAHAGGGRAR